MTTRHLVITGAVLLGLWATSLGLSFVHLGGASLPVALMIASIKAVIVAAIFMELRGAPASILLAFASGLTMAMLLLVLTVADVLTR